MERSSLKRECRTVIWHGSVEDQKRSGRCWIYASHNMIRKIICRKYGLDDIHLSTNYIYYYDQLAKAASFLKKIQEMRDKPLDDPSLSKLLREPVSSVGQWYYFASLAEKYGIVPLEVMPDTAAAADGTVLTRKLSTYLRKCAYRIREENEADFEVMIAETRELLDHYLGVLPADFERAGQRYTPISFWKDYCGIDLSDYITLIHHPSDRWPAPRLYHEKEVRNERDPLWDLLSVEMELIKELSRRQLQDGTEVVIGCDPRYAGNRSKGELSTEIYGSPVLPKKEAIAYRQIKACHVMSIDGLDPDGRWRVQDSHGSETGPDGHYIMTEDWFDNYVLSAVIKKEYLPEEYREIIGEPAVYMPKTERF